MIGACERVLIFSAGVPDSELLSRELPYRGAILHELIVLGEAAKHISVETAAASPGIAWVNIARLRDKLVHYYHGLDNELLLDVIRKSAPELLPQLRALRGE
jgi:uncharacterized protein with HEPN domain